jgi:hypothetical protein
VHEVDGCLPLTAFLAQHVYARQPVVMRGCAADSPALKAWKADAYLDAVAGNWSGSDAHARAGSGIRDVPGCHAGTVHNPACPMYLARLGMPRALRRNMLMPRTLRCSAVLEELVSELWFWYRFVPEGRAMTGSWHWDEGHYVVIQVDGLKEFTLSDGISIVLDGNDDAAAGSDRSTFNQSVVLAPGDVLFMPRKTHHQVKAHPGRNVAVTLDLNFPPPESAHDPPYHEWPLFNSIRGGAGSAAFYSKWRAGLVPARMAELVRRCEGEAEVAAAADECEGEDGGGTLADAPELDDAEMVWDLAFRSGLGWDF